MPIYYRTYQSTSQDEKKHGKWYGKAVVMNNITTKEMSEEIQENVSVKRADVIAVLAELKNVIKRNLQAGNRVVLDDIGAFKVNLRTKGAISNEKFGPDNILGLKVIFQPEKYKHNGRYVKPFIEEATTQKLTSLLPGGE